MSFDYLPGEMEAWGEFFKRLDNAGLITYLCSHGHTLESPVVLTQEQVDQRCAVCAEKK